MATHVDRSGSSTLTRAYYNEWDSYAAAWLRNLIAAGHIPPGDVDERSIVDVRADDLRGYRSAHFFAGIGGWPYALRLAGVPDDAEVWTGSCPCQPLSCAGQRKGDADERHLWPAFYRLIVERRPATIFGEQVSGKDGLEWLSAVRADLEGIGYAIGAADLPACSVGAPHIRQRLFWVAYRSGAGLEKRQEQSARQERAAIERGGDAGAMVNAASEQVGLPGRAREQGSAVGELGDAKGERKMSHLGFSERTFVESDRGFWSDLEWLPCIDGNWRPTKPGLFPLAHGVPARVGRLRAYGNAIAPPLAAEFIMAAMELMP